MRIILNFFNKGKNLVRNLFRAVENFMHFILHPNFMAMLFMELENDPLNLVCHFNRRIQKGYQLNTVVRFFNVVVIGTNIDCVLNKIKHN